MPPDATGTLDSNRSEGQASAIGLLDAKRPDQLIEVRAALRDAAFSRSRASRRLNLPRVGLAIAATVVLAQPARTEPTFMGLGNLPGGTYSRAWAVSADGSTVVGNAVEPPGRPLWCLAHSDGSDDTRSI